MFTWLSRMLPGARFHWIVAILLLAFGCGVLVVKGLIARAMPVSVPELAFRAQRGDKRAAERLEQLGPSAVPDLAEALGTRDNMIRTFVWEQRALPLTNLSASVRRQIAGKLPPPNAVLYREAAALALGRLGSNAAPAIDSLLHALADGDGLVSSYAASTLAKIGPQAVPGLISALTNQDSRGRIYAANALEKLKGSAAPAVPSLIHALRDPDPVVRDSASRALVATGAPAIPSLVDLVRSGDSSRAAAIDILRTMGTSVWVLGLRASNEDTVGALCGLLDDSDPEVRFAGLRLLRFIPGKAALAEGRIRSLTTDPEPKVRDLAAELAKRYPAGPLPQGG